MIRSVRYHEVKLFLDLAINTGMRAMEIMGLQFSEIDFERAEIRLPYTRTKEAKDKVIPLNGSHFERGQNRARGWQSL